MKTTTWLLLLIIWSSAGAILAQEYMPLWPAGKMPNSKGLKLEHVEARERVTQIETPGMYVCLTSKEENTGTAVLIFPPGGYQKLTYNIAGLQLAKWFNTIGVNAFVVMYRLPTSPDLIERQLGPLQDAQRAMKMVRQHAGEWGIDPDRVGVMGCSAGGHLAAAMCTMVRDRSSIGDELDAFRVQPDFQILISAVISLQDFSHRGSRDNLLGDDASKELIDLYSNELHVTSTTAAAFIVHAADDPVVNPENSIRYFQVLQQHQIGSSLHIFPHGKHSISLRNNPGSTELWTILCEAWLKEMGLLKGSNQ